MSLAIYILVMAGVTYLIRMIPFTLFRGKIRSRFFRSFLQIITLIINCFQRRIRQYIHRNHTPHIS